MHYMATIGDRYENELVYVALVLVDILDHRVSVRLYAVCLALESGHGLLERALLKFSTFRVLEIFFCERHFHGEYLQELLLASNIVVSLYDAYHAIPDDVRDIHADALAHEGVAALLVYHGALLVHHVIIFEKVLSDAEVVLLDLLLRALNAL